MILARQELMRSLINADSQTKFINVRKLTRIEAPEHLGVQ